MKKYLFLVLTAAASLLVSCSREPVEAPVSRIVIHATVNPGTRTSYSQEKYFTWIEGDNVSLMVTNDETGVPDVIRLTAQSTGAVTDLVGSSVDGWTPADYAFYPKDTKGDYDWVSSDLEKSVDAENKVMNLRLYGTINGNVADPLSNVPMIGKRTADDTFAFKTATGVLKFTVENIPADTYFFRLDHTEDVPLNGYFSFGDDCTLYMANAIQGWAQKYVYFTPAAEGETRDFYVPIPVGTIPSGLQVSIESASRGTIVLATTKEPIEVERNRVIRTPKLTVPTVSWTSIGMGKFIDHFIWPFAGLSDYAQVEFFQNSDNANLFRIAKPYSGPEADEWFEFDVTNPDAVTSVDYFTDVLITRMYGDTEVGFKPYVRNGHDYGYNYSSVLKYQEGGLPANVQIGPCYRGAEFDTAADPYAYEVGKDHEKLVIEIVFPGCEPYQQEFEPGQIVLTTDMVTASDVCTHDGGGLPALVDGDPGTYWHSNWYYAVDRNDPVYGIYFDIALEQPVTKFHFVYLVRKENANAAPTALVIGVSNDGTTWSQVGGTISTDAMTGATAGARVELPVVDAGAAYKYVRLGLTDSKSGDAGSLTGDLSFTGYKKCVNMAELMLFRD